MLANAPKKISLAEIEETTFGKGDSIGAAYKSIGESLGTRKIGCGLVTVAAGKKACPYHLHYAQEELFVIVEGEGTLRYDGELYPIKAGEVFFAPPGAGTAHHIINTSDADLKYFAFSSLEYPEVCYYPDSKKYNAFSYDQDQNSNLRFIAKEEDAVDYWEGEG